MANENPGRVAQYLAGNLLALRKKKGFSQQQLAKLADIPRSTLTHMESGDGNPSLSNLSRISSALQVGIEELLSRPRNEIELRAEKEIPVQSRAQGRAQISKLLPEQVKGLELDKFEIQPNSIMPGHPHLNGAKEYLAVLSGEITVAVAGDQYKVTKGAVLAFPGDQPHSYRNSGSTKAIAISVVIPVVFVANRG